jgi:hypothetical protein
MSNTVDIKSLPQMSASQIKVATTCLRKYYYQYVLYEKTPKNMYGATGTAAHEAIEVMIKTQKVIDTEDHIKKKVAQTLQEWEKKKLTINFRSKEEAAVKAVVEMLSSEGIEKIQTFLQNQRIIDTERFFELPFPSENPICRMTGFIDLTTEDWVVDWKTSATNPTKGELSHDPQMIVYYWAFTQLYGKEPKRIIRYKLPDHTPQDYDLTDIKTKFTSLFWDINFVLQSRELLKQIIPLRKTLDSTCRQCPFFERCYNEPSFRIR